MEAMNANEIMKKLQAPFLPEEIEWRVDRGQKTARGNFVIVLAYVTNRAIQHRLDEVFGPFGWRNEYREWKAGSQLCGISVKVDGEWITKWDGSDDSNMDAVKGGLSGAMKRTAVQWGIGRYLYNLDQTRIPLMERGENYANVKVKVSGKDEYIQGYWDTPQLPAWALPEGFQYKHTPKQQELPTSPPSAPQTQDKAPEAPVTQQRQTVQNGLNAKSRVINMMKELGWDWKALGEFATEVLKRKISKVISDIKTEEEWKQVEDQMIVTKQAS